MHLGMWTTGLPWCNRPAPLHHRPLPPLLSIFVQLGVMENNAKRWLCNKCHSSVLMQIQLKGLECPPVIGETGGGGHTLHGVGLKTIWSLARSSPSSSSPMSTCLLTFHATKLGHTPSLALPLPSAAVVCDYMLPPSPHSCKLLDPRVVAMAFGPLMFFLGWTYSESEDNPFIDHHHRDWPRKTHVDLALITSPLLQLLALTYSLLHPPL